MLIRCTAFCQATTVMIRMGVCDIRFGNWRSCGDPIILSLYGDVLQVTLWGTQMKLTWVILSWVSLWICLCKSRVSSWDRCMCWLNRMCATICIWHRFSELGFRWIRRFPLTFRGFFQNMHGSNYIMLAYFVGTAVFLMDCDVVCWCCWWRFGFEGNFDDLRDHRLCRVGWCKCSSEPESLFLI